MARLMRIIDLTSERIGKIASVLIVILTLGIAYDITVRYFFSMSNFWAYDSVYMIYGAYTMLGAAYCLVTDMHVRMDLVYGRFSERGKAVIDVIGYLVLFFPLMVVLVYKCGEHAIWAYNLGERSSSSVWRPSLVPFKFTIEFGFILLLLQGVVKFIRSLITVIAGGSNES